MESTAVFLRESMFFNSFVAILMVFLVVRGNAQSESFGAPFNFGGVVESSAASFSNLQVTDSVQSQLRGTIAEVCQAKGCWMKVDLEDGSQVFVKFKDYGFFVPTDSAGKVAVLNGRAFVAEISVADQKHYAMDGGASPKEINAITEPKRTLRFEADGVLIND